MPGINTKTKSTGFSKLTMTRNVLLSLTSTIDRLQNINISSCVKQIRRLRELAIFPDALQHVEALVVRSQVQDRCEIGIFQWRGWYVT